MQIVFAVDGMSCQHCVRRVTAALGKVPGVRVDEVTVGRARVDAPDQASVEAARAALERAGHAARVETAPGSRP